MRLPKLDYYRQFADVDQEEENRVRRQRRAHERALELERVPDLDLSGTEWPELPDSEVVNASIYTARGRVNGYPDRHAEGLRTALAELHGVEPERIVVGNGAAELLQAAALSLMEPGDELLTPWPSYPLYPLMAARAGGRPVSVESHERIEDRIGERTRLLVLCNPNDPTGAYMPAERVAALASALPERAHLVVDEALVHFQDAEPPDSVLRLTDALPRMLVVRTFSKVYGLSGLRAGYAVGSTASSSVLDAISPVLGVNALTQSAVSQALKIGGAEIERRRAAVITERARLMEALHELPVAVTHSQANFVWLSAQGMSGLALTNALRREGVIVASGGPLGAEDHIRATVRNAAATERLLSALAKTLA
ncbi:MAG: histidinol-phosphate transaminase [Thermoleophilaceae bacterium]